MIMKKLVFNVFKEIKVKMQLTKKMLVILAVVFSAGFAGGMVTEHVLHLVQSKKSAHGLAGHQHGEHAY